MGKKGKVPGRTGNLFFDCGKVEMKKRKGGRACFETRAFFSEKKKREEGKLGRAPGIPGAWEPSPKGKKKKFESRNLNSDLMVVSGKIKTAEKKKTGGV